MIVIFIPLSLSLQGHWTLGQLKEALHSRAGIASSHLVQLCTRVTPSVPLRGDNKRLDDILEGNTWLLVECFPFVEVEQS
jgi:hypothetical protein